MGGVLSLKKALLLLLVLQLLSMFTGCKQFKLGNLTWDKFHVRYWIILDDEKLLEKSFVLKVEELNLPFELKSPCVRKVHRLWVPTAAQMIWTTDDGERWRVSVSFENELAFTLESNRDISWSVELCDESVYDFLIGICLKDAQAIFPEIDRRNIMLRNNLSLNSSKYTSLILPEHLPPEIEKRIITEEEMFRGVSDDGTWSFPEETGKRFF
jgi:hypothetical protein